MSLRKVNAASYQNRAGASTALTAAELGQQIRSLVQAHPGVQTWLFSGPLGAGKSTAIRAILRAYGVSRRVPSPTFTLVQTYRLADGRRLYHFDAYRVLGSHEWGGLGIDEVVGEKNSIVCVEWPERLRGFVWGPHGRITIQILPRGRRVRWSIRR